MSKPLIFVSYRHGAPWTALARALHVKLDAISDGAGFDLFLDSEDIRSGEKWREKVDDALARCTHFVALLCDEYWARSNECLREMFAAVARYEASHVEPRLLPVLAANMKPEYLTFDSARQRGDLKSDDPQLRAIGDINFLGPYDGGLLVSLEWKRGMRQDRQLAQLTQRLLGSGGLPKR